MNVIEIKCTCDMMPNQFEGTVNGKPFYFRARWGGWRLDVAEPGGDPIMGGETIAYGEDDRAGWWEVEEAEAVCRKHLEAYAATTSAGAPEGEKE